MGEITNGAPPPVRHKYGDSNGAPPPGAPLVLFFYFCARANSLSPTIPHTHQAPLASSTGQPPVLPPGGPGFESQAPQFFYAFKMLFDTYLCLNMFKLV